MMTSASGAQSAWGLNLASGESSSAFKQLPYTRHRTARSGPCDSRSRAAAAKTGQQTEAQDQDPGP
jgi:hypothetical protein